MKFYMIPALAIMALTACGEVDKILKDPEPEKPKTCVRVYSPKAYITNWTGALLDIEMGYKEWDNNNYINVQVPSNQSQEVRLRQFSHNEQGYGGDCSNYSGGEIQTQLRLTLNSFSSVKSCNVNNRQDWVIIVAVSAACPPYATEQEKPL